MRDWPRTWVYNPWIWEIPSGRIHQKRNHLRPELILKNFPEESSSRANPKIGNDRWPVMDSHPKEKARSTSSRHWKDRCAPVSLVLRRALVCLLAVVLFLCLFHSLPFLAAICLYDCGFLRPRVDGRVWKRDSPTAAFLLFSGGCRWRIQHQFSFPFRWIRHGCPFLPDGQTLLIPSPDKFISFSFLFIITCGAFLLFKYLLRHRNKKEKGIWLMRP